MKTLLLLALTLPLHSQTLGSYETFTNADNADSWNYYDYQTEETIAPFWKLPGSTNPEIYGTFASVTRIALFAADNSSSQFFIGDYTSAGIDTIECQLYLEDASSFAEVEFYLIAGGEFYHSDPVTNFPTGWSTFTNSLSKDQWYVLDEAGEFSNPIDLTPLILSDVTQIGVNFLPASEAAIGTSVALDNFGLFPDLTAPTPTISQTSNGEITLTFQQIAGLSYNLETSSTLKRNSWTPIDAETSDIRGTGPFQKNIPLAAKAFFRTATYALLINTPIPTNP